MVSYQCSQCNHILADPLGKCPECGANLFLLAPIPPDERVTKFIPCKHCNIDMDPTTYLCPNCGTIRWSHFVSTFGIFIFASIVFTAGLVMIIYSKTQGNATASGLIIAMCGLVNVALWAFMAYAVIELRKILKNHGEIMEKNTGAPYVELKRIVTKPAPLPVYQAQPVNEQETIRQAMLQAEKDAMSIKDFDEAAKALNDLYNDWIDNKIGHLRLVGGLNYITGKLDGLFCINQYLQGNKEYDAVHLRNLIAYHEGFPGDVSHCGSLEMIKWGYERTITDLKDRRR